VFHRLVEEDKTNNKGNEKDEVNERNAKRKDGNNEDDSQSEEHDHKREDQIDTKQFVLLICVFAFEILSEDDHNHHRHDLERQEEECRHHQHNTDDVQSLEIH